MDRPKLTIGMAVYDDVEGAWFTINSLRLHHLDAGPFEIIAIDNAPASDGGYKLRGEINAWMHDVKYIAMADPIGTAQSRNRVFEEASGELVVCIDSHILLDYGAITSLLDFYATNPSVHDDLFHGPLLYPDNRTVHAFFKDTWSDGMWGQWAPHPRASSFKRKVDIDRGKVSVNIECDNPFEIDAMGLGLFAAKKDSWLGFNKDFREFGGEEWYIHTKYKQAGRKIWCLPKLRWMHLFAQTRTKPIPYPASNIGKFRNYVIGLTELGLPLDNAIAHFTGLIGEGACKRIVEECLSSK
jgi:glycosyltransferase involved in cell wall biosynthesis